MNMLEGIKAMRRLPLFPLIPLIPVTLVTGCIAINIATYRRVRRLEQRLDEAQRLGPGRLAEGERPIAATR